MRALKIIFQVVGCVYLLMAVNCMGQVYNTLHNFGPSSRDGYSPTGLVLDGNTFYGGTASGGSNYNGILFKINIDGTGYSMISCFTDSGPQTGMVLIDNTLYGTTYTGGSAWNGTLFRIKTNGTDFSVLHSFSPTVPSSWGTNSDGNRPTGDLATDGTAFYGMATYGGASGNSTVFKINSDGTGFTVLKAFSAIYSGTDNVSSAVANRLGTNCDGARPTSGLILNGNTLYGTTYGGGLSNGVVFAMQTDGTGYRVLKYFSCSAGYGTNADGANPIAGLTLNGDTLYGVAVDGGTGAEGTVFKLKTNGTDFVTLHNFHYTDGAFPRTPLLLNGSTLYGTTAAGGIFNSGTIFMLQTNGDNFTILEYLDQHTANQCNSKFILRGKTLFGTAATGGITSAGVVFGLTVEPRILPNCSIGFQSDEFAFDFVGISNQTAIIDFSPSLTAATWRPVQTNSLTGSPQHLSIPKDSQATSGFYRIRDSSSVLGL